MIFGSVLRGDMALRTDVGEKLHAEVTDECGQYGQVEKVVMYPDRLATLVRILLRDTSNDCVTLEKFWKVLSVSEIHQWHITNAMDEQRFTNFIWQRGLTFLLHV